MARTLILCTGILLCPAAAGGQPRAIDTQQSILTVRAFKAGLFSALGHDHDIAAPIARGSVDLTARRVEIEVKAAALRVRDVKASEKDRAEIQSTMLGPKVLDAQHYPEIVFRSTAVEPTGSGSWRVRGNLTLHGQTQPVVVEVRETGGRFVGAARFRQTSFGMQPVKVAGGTIRVKDELRIEFVIQLARSP